MNVFAIAILIVLIIGLSTTFWSLVGLGRFLHGQSSRLRQPKHRRSKVTRRRVAVLIAAHNEALVLGGTLAAAARLLPKHQIYVVSDASTDATAKIARAAGVQVLALRKNRGKAGALVAGLRQFKLHRHYDVVLILDADTRLTRHYLTTGLPMFNDPTVMAVAGRAHTLDSGMSSTWHGFVLLAYRERLYTLVQVFMKYGQAAHWANAVAIVPGFASMYRTAALKHIDITAPGIIIEDYSMTFQLHAKQLGRVAFHPQAAVAYTQDPDNIRDYINQCKRWSLGFWQSVRHHRLPHSLFWVSLMFFIFDMLASSLVLCLLLPIALLNVASGALFHESLTTLTGVVQLQYLAFGVVLPDYVLTLIVAAVLKRPSYTVLGLVFIILRLVDAGVYLWACQQAWVQRSSGIWVSPARRAPSVQSKPI